MDHREDSTPAGSPPPPRLAIGARELLVVIEREAPYHPVATLGVAVSGTLALLAVGTAELGRAMGEGAVNLLTESLRRRLQSLLASLARPL